MGEEILQQLIEGCKKMDRKSQQLLYEKLFGFAMNICVRYTSNRYEAAEVLNEGFFKALNSIGKYDPERPFKPWLGKIMYHASIDYYRTNIRNARMEDLEKACHISVESSRKLEYDDLLAMVQSLPNVARLVFNLYAIDGYSHEEIAEMLDIQPATSRSNLYKARKKLQEMLNPSMAVKPEAGTQEVRIIPIDRSGIDPGFSLDIIKS